MEIITQNYVNDKKVNSSIINFFKNYKVSSVLKSSNAYKKKGIPAATLFQYIFTLIFANRSMYMNMLTGKHAEGFAKDTIYRFMNSVSINWIRFTSLLSARIVTTSLEKLTSEDRVNVLILDDTMFERNSSKKVELLSKIYDHAKKSYKYGFRLLTLGWSDGNTFLPVNSCLLSSEKKKTRVAEEKPIDRRTAGYSRRCLAQTKATSVMLELIDQAKKADLPASYVLFDTWFCFPASIIQIKKRALDVIAMVKKTPKMHFLYNGQMQSITEIYKQNRKRRGRSKYLLSVDITVIKDNESTPARVIYVRNKNKKKDYLALITTDLTISEEEVIRIYGKRWDIEVFFKVCKSYLKLGKECNSLSYDAMTAHAAVVFTRYMMLAVENRQTLDNRTLGEIFYLLTDELADISLIQAFQMLIQLFIDTCSDRLSLSADEIEKLMDAFLLAL
ncbi:MAG: transposase, partial [Clostridiaceae bacterium]